MQINKYLLVSAVVSAAFLILPASALAATQWYVDASTGSDSNDCLSAVTACLTIQGAVNKAAAGDTINVAAGTYSGNVIIPTGLDNLTIQGTGSVVFNLGSGYGFNLDNPPAVITGFTLSGFTVNSSSGTTYAFKAYQANGLTLTNDTFNGNGFGGGVDINTTSNINISDVTASGFAKNGFAVTSAYTSGDSSTPSSNIIFNNITASNNAWTGISFYTTGNSGGSASINGIQFTGANTISGNTVTGIFLEGDTDANFATFATPANKITTDGSTLNMQDVAFSGNPAYDIVNYQTAPVNAIGATFGGVTGDAMTAPQRTAEDGHIIDQLDHSNLGLVSYYTPAAVTTDPATSLALTSATIKGTDGSTAADNTSFWWGTMPISGTLTPGPNPGASEFPATGWTHDGGLGGVGAGAPFGEPLTGLTSGQTYYFVAWVEIGGTWYPGQVLTFNTTVCNTNATQTIVSDATTTFNGDDGNGNAVPVTMTGITSTYWTASIPGATWIWSTAVVADSTITDTETFTRTFNITGTPLSATLEIAADNYYTVSINGNNIDGGAGTTTDNNFTTAATYSIPASDLNSGSNTLTIVGENEATPSDSNAGDNPAGILYSLTINNNECALPPAPTPTVITDPATAITLDGATLNGTDGAVSGDNTSFWWGSSAPTGPITTPGPNPAATAEFPAGWSHDNGLSPVSASGNFNEALTGLTPGQTYYFVAWVEVAGIWYPGEVLSFIMPVPAVAAMCPANTTISATPLEIDSVDSSSAVATSSTNLLNLGQSYVLVSSGTWTNSNLNVADAAYSSVDTWANYMEGYDISPHFLGPQEFDLQVDGNFVNWGAYNTGHTYSYLYAGTNAPVNLGVFDGDSNPPAAANSGWYGDNSGSLSVSIYPCIPNTGTLTVEKSAVGGNNTFNFAGTGSIGSFHITTAGTSAGGTGYSQTFTLAPGTYTVTEGTQPKGWTQTDSDCSSVSVTAGGAATCTITDTSNKLLGVIRGTKYVDEDGDGSLKDGDHHTLPGVTIKLTGPGGAQTTVTDSHGNYQFVGLVAGTYTVSEQVPSGWAQTVPSSGNYTVHLSAGQVVKHDDFGDFKLGSVSGNVFNDMNANGHKDAGDTGLVHWTVTLKGPGSHGTTQTTTTDSNGNYSFANVGPGTYTLSETLQSGWTQTAHPPAVTVFSGTNAAGENFGNTQHPKQNDNDFWSGGDNDNGNNGQHNGQQGNNGNNGNNNNYGFGNGFGNNDNNNDNHH